MSYRARRVMRVALLSLLVLLIASASALATSVQVRVEEGTRVYQYPSASSKSGALTKAMTLTLTAASNGWARVTYKDRTGYIPLKYVTLVNPIKAYAAVNANVYRGVGSDLMGTVPKGTVPKGTVVYVLGVNGSYARVQNEAGTSRGYIKGSQLTRTKPQTDGDAGSGEAVSAVPAALRSTTTSPAVSRPEYVIYVAQNLVGAPYAASANPPKTFDSAKFAAYCYDKARSGCLKGSSKAQGYDERYLMVSSMANLKRGDLVCFNTEDDDDLCDHVGIYIGSGYFIHASSAAKKVIVSSLSSGYYCRAFSWGRRIF